MSADLSIFKKKMRLKDLMLWLLQVEKFNFQAILTAELILALKGMLSMLVWQKLLFWRSMEL